MYSGRPTAVVHPMARKRIRVRGRIAPPPGVAAMMAKRLNVTVLDPATSGDVGGRAGLTGARAGTVIWGGMVSVAGACHLQLDPLGRGAREPLFGDRRRERLRDAVGAVRRGRLRRGG